jgi:hypothetical protein
MEEWKSASSIPLFGILDLADSLAVENIEQVGHPKIALGIDQQGPVRPSPLPLAVASPHLPNNQRRSQFSQWIEGHSVAAFSPSKTIPESIRTEPFESRSGSLVGNSIANQLNSKRRLAWRVGAALSVLTMFALLAFFIVHGKQDSNRAMAGNTEKCWRAITIATAFATKEQTGIIFGSYPTNSAGYFNFPSFSEADFVSLEEFHRKISSGANRAANQISSISVLDVDHDLAQYKAEIRDFYLSDAHMHAGNEELVRALHEQRFYFTSPEAYAKRFSLLLLGQADFEQKYKANQQEIDRMSERMINERKRHEELRESMKRKDDDIRTTLTQRYNRLFE